MKGAETSIGMFGNQVPLHIIFSTKRFVSEGTEPSHVNSTGAKCRLRKSMRKGRMSRIYIGLQAMIFHC